jgi:hypothetical protein
MLVVIMAGMGLLLRKQRTALPVIIDTTNYDDLLLRAKNAVAHVTIVSEVYALVENLDGNPDALELLKKYPETVRAAAWLHYINILGDDLHAADDALSLAHRLDANYLGTSKGYRIETAQNHVNSLRIELDEAVKRSGQPSLRLV